jgi:uncharacterized coiled-coil protein SlyX
MKQNQLVEFLTKNIWAIALVVSSVIAQWAVFGVRIDNIEARQDRQDAVVSDLRDQVQESQRDVAALSEKVDSVKESVDYIRNRIDAALKN